MAYESLFRLVDRREFLRRGAALLTIGATPALLAACGGSSNSGSAAAPKASGSIDYLSWEGYDIPDPMKAWKAAIPPF